MEGEKLRREIVVLRRRVNELEKEVVFLKTHPVFMQGIKGETIVKKLTGGKLTSFAESYDLVIGQTIKVEVKFSKLNIPVKGSITRRWNWSKPLGWKDKGKDFDFLLLVGDKDKRYEDQYPDGSPYVFFLIPMKNIQSILTRGQAIGANVQLTTNLIKAKSEASKAIKEHLVSAAEISTLIEDRF